MKYRKLGSLDEAHAVSLLLFIEKKEEIIADDLKKSIGSYYASKSLAESMSDDGLIEIENIEKPRIRIIYRITEKGKRVAEKLKEISDIMDEGMVNSETMIDSVTAMDVRKK